MEPSAENIEKFHLPLHEGDVGKDGKCDISMAQQRTKEEPLTYFALRGACGGLP